MSKKSPGAGATRDDIEISQQNAEADIPSRGHEILGLICGLIGLVTLLAMVSYDGLDTTRAPVRDENIIGPAGMWTAFVLFSSVGAAAWMLNLAFFVHAGALFSGRARKVTVRSAAGIAVIVLLGAVALHTLLRGELLASGHPAGGFIGSVLGELSISVVSTTGTCIIAFGGILLTLLVVTDVSLFLVGRSIGSLLAMAFRHIFHFAARVIRAFVTELPADDPEPVDAPAVEPVIRKKPRRAADVEEDDAASVSGESEPKIVTSTPKKQKKSVVAPVPAPEDAPGEFVLPSLSLLVDPGPSSSRVDEKLLRRSAERLVEVLAQFKVMGEVTEIHPGPVVTMFEFQPRSGTRLNSISGLANELAMALEAQKVRIVAPIPGKNAVGFELPNKERETVRLREILEDDSWQRAKGALPMALGKDISGLPYTVDLAKMPHLLMAGTTGSGKSVAVNTMLLSFLFRYRPEDLRLLLIDPKMIEFQPYNHIPHLLLPVVTDMSLANLALKWAVDEMERRYQLFADMGGATKNLESYNAKVEKILADVARREAHPNPACTAVTASGDVVEFGEFERMIPDKLPDKLPLIVICIDEFADLMMVAAKEVESSVARLAQKARAAGIHLTMATQRPSTDVVTGLIKSNFPTRLSCKVPSAIDSRTILNTDGAESLLGNGDMLIIPPGRADAIRVQGAFVSEEEVSAVTEHLRAQRRPRYDEEILKPRGEDGDGGEDGEMEKDEMYDRAVAIVAEAQVCSISLLQRKLSIGYNRSAKIVEMMEKEGVVGPSKGAASKRDVLISPQ